MDRGFSYLIGVAVALGAGARGVSIPQQGHELIVQDGKTTMGRVFATDDSRQFRVVYPGGDRVEDEITLFTHIPDLDLGLRLGAAPEVIVRQEGRERQALPVALVLDRAAVPLELKMAVHFLDGISPRQIVSLHDLRPLDYPDALLREPPIGCGGLSEWIWATIFYRNDDGKTEDTPNGRVLLRGCIQHGTEIDVSVNVVYPVLDASGVRMVWRRAPRDYILDARALRDLAQRVPAAIDHTKRPMLVLPKAVAIDYSTDAPTAGVLGIVGHGGHEDLVYVTLHQILGSAGCPGELRDLDEDENPEP